MVKNFEEMVFSNTDEEAAYLIAMGGLILHEYTHLGDRKSNKGRLTGQGMQNENPKGSVDPNDNGKQNVPSKYGHRGRDIEITMNSHQQSIDVSKNETEGHNEWRLNHSDVKKTERIMKSIGTFNKAKEIFMKKGK